MLLRRTSAALAEEQAQEAAAQIANVRVRSDIEEPKAGNAPSGRGASCSVRVPVLGARSAGGRGIHSIPDRTGPAGSNQGAGVPAGIRLGSRPDRIPYGFDLQGLPVWICNSLADKGEVDVRASARSVHPSRADGRLPDQLRARRSAATHFDLRNVSDGAAARGRRDLAPNLLRPKGRGGSSGEPVPRAGR
jgi:hypothetical protein